MKIGLYFGSFNPIHIGHLIIATFVVNNTECEQTWLVVSPHNPLKNQKSLLNEYDRLHLVRLAINGDLRLHCSDIEFKLPKPSYTITTLQFLSDKYPFHEFFIIIGSDSWQNLSKWKSSDTLLNNYQFLVYPRPGFEIQHHNSNVNLLKAPSIEISSTMIRHLIREKKSARYMVPQNVLEEIERNGYYKI